MEYEKIKYPDGQISVKIQRVMGSSTDHGISISILSYEDLFTVRSIADAFSNNSLNGTNDLILIIRCLLGQRSDRRFSALQSFDLKLIAEVINNAKFRKVRIFDPHSDVSLALIDRSEKLSPNYYIGEAKRDIENKKDSTLCTLVSPDAGAYKKVFELGQEFGREVVAAVKHRDLKGNIDLKFIGDVKSKDCLIVDDLADGGYTFVVLSKALKEQGAKTVSLYVSHGYFTKGFNELKKNIDYIYCTDSVREINDPFVTQFKLAI